MIITNKKTISLIIFLCCCKALLAQEHHAYWLDKRYMQCWFKPPIDTICCPHKDLPDGKWFIFYRQRPLFLFAKSKYSAEIAVRLAVAD